MKTCYMLCKMGENHRNMIPFWKPTMHWVSSGLESQATSCSWGGVLLSVASQFLIIFFFCFALFFVCLFRLTTSWKLVQWKNRYLNYNFFCSMVPFASGFQLMNDLMVCKSLTWYGVLPLCVACFMFWFLCFSHCFLMYDSFFFLMYVKESRSRFVKDYYSFSLNYVVMASILVSEGLCVLAEVWEIVL